MFEDQNQNNQQPPNNLPFGQPQNPFIPPQPTSPQANPNVVQPPTNQPTAVNPEDMFAETDKPAGGAYPPVNRGYNPNYTSPGQGQPYGNLPPTYNQELFGGRSFPWGKFITVFIIILVLVGGAGAAYWGYSYFMSLNKPAESTTTLTPPVETDNNQIVPATTTNDQTDTIDNITPTPLTEEIKDLDGDGLTDEEEASFGTKKDQVDTDVDGLTDWAEIRIYKTDPLNPDTDGDGYKDGQEVINGYDPLLPGSARLYEVPPTEVPAGQ